VSAAFGSRGRASLYTCRVRHVRQSPVRNDFTYRTFLWLVDLDDLPRLPGPLRPLAGFNSKDHLGDPAATIRANVEEFLAGKKINLRGGKVLMLANARVFGYVFNPLTVYWCHNRDGALVCVIAEVHNTYGQRHCYLLKPDARGRISTDKQFYVSPFNAVDGVYQMLLPEPDGRLALSIRLKLPGQPLFVATLRGEQRPGTAANLVRLNARFPLSTLVISARIRWQGVKLYLRGLPVVPRPQ
jgi:DUF1365 family protein